MVKNVILNKAEYSVEQLLMAKGRGAASVVQISDLIINVNTVESEAADVAIVVPNDNKFIILIKPPGPLKQSQPVSIMSKFVLKSLKIVEQVQTPRNRLPYTDQEFAAKWRPSGPRNSR